jgi:membrane fusion protein, heavy metal efflux system
MAQDIPRMSLLRRHLSPFTRLIFKIEPVRLVTFRPEQVTEGNIAIDDDLTTPVFSHYSGRVIKLIAKLGDHVEPGAPLFEIQASEFVQAQNDLIAR